MSKAASSTLRATINWRRCQYLTKRSNPLVNRAIFANANFVLNRRAIQQICERKTRILATRSSHSLFHCQIRAVVNIVGTDRKEPVEEDPRGSRTQNVLQRPRTPAPAPDRMTTQSAGSF